MSVYELRCQQILAVDKELARSELRRSLAGTSEGLEAVWVENTLPACGPEDGLLTVDVKEEEECRDNHAGVLCVQCEVGYSLSVDGSCTVCRPGLSALQVLGGGLVIALGVGALLLLAHREAMAWQARGIRMRAASLDKAR